MKRSLFTSNFKIYTKRIASFLLALVLFYAGADGIVTAVAANYDNRSATEKITAYQFADYYALPENSLDVLILGSSHAMCSYNPEWFESEFGMTAFNMGTALQQPDTAYYLLKEVLKTHKPKYLIYDVYFKTMSEEYSKDQTITVLKELKPSTNTIALAWNNLNFNDRLDFFNTYVNPFGRCEKFFHEAEHQDISRIDAYRGQGFYSSPNIISQELLLPENHPFANEYESFNERQKVYLKKLVALAKENGIKVILVSAPLPPTIYSRIDYYDEITAEISGIAEECNVPFEDFMVSGAAVLQDTDFADQGHMNQNGSVKFKKCFVDAVRKYW